jgi:hypothetical protein
VSVHDILSEELDIVSSDEPNSESEGECPSEESSNTSTESECESETSVMYRWVGIHPSCTKFSSKAACSVALREFKIPLTTWLRRFFQTWSTGKG